MDRQGGDRYRGPSRWSPPGGDQPFRHANNHLRNGGDAFSATRHHPYRGGARDHPSGGGGGRSPGFRPGPGGEPMPRRGGGFQVPGRGLSPGNNDGGKLAKLFIGSVPRTATEEEIRPLFEEHGRVMEVALIRDRRTGQQQGCCFIKYATSDEADRAIRALHNQYTLPGGVGPIQVRYADGERERNDAFEHKLFVGVLNKLATEQEVGEIFAPYGRVEDVYLMRDDLKQSRGCGFIKFSNREMAAAAINALNGVYTMRGCEQPLIVRFADPKRPRPGESRGGPAVGGPGFGSQPQAPSGPWSVSNFDEPMGGRPNNIWPSMSPESSGPSSNGFGGHLLPKAFPAPSSTGFNPAYIQPIDQQMSTLQKPLTSQQFPETLQAHLTQQNSLPYSQTQGSLAHAHAQQLSQLQNLNSSSFAAFSQALPSQQLIGLGGQLPSSQPLLHMGASANLHIPTNLPQAVTANANQQMLPGSTTSQSLQQPALQQAQGLLQRQVNVLQASFQPPQQVFSQLQLQLMQPSNPTQQQSSQQSSLTAPQQLFSSTQAATPTEVIPSSSTLLQHNIQAAPPLTCNWTEHTSPEGFKYYYNSVTKESKWEKPEELTLIEQQQKMLQQQRSNLVAVQQLPSQPQMQTSQVQSMQQISQVQQSQAHMHFRQQVQLQQLQPLSFQASGAISNHNIQVPRMQ